MQSPGSSDPAAKAVPSERAKGPMTRMRTSSERQGEATKIEGPCPPENKVPRAGALRVTNPRIEEPSGKVKKVSKSKKKDTGKMGDKKRKALADLMLSEGAQRGSQWVEKISAGGGQQATTAARSRVITSRSLAKMTEGPSWMVRPDVYCTGLYKGELPTLTVSELMEWDREEGTV